MGKKIVRLLSALLSIFIIAGAPIASAFTGNGLGTALNPYRIASCTQLADIDDDLDGYYVLARNINCDGVGFVHLADSADFTGTLDGQGHRISNITMDDYGLFKKTTNAEIKNIFIDSGVNNGDSATSFVFEAVATQLENLHSAMSITPNGAYVGGLVGSMVGPSTLFNSSFTGNIETGTSYAGGLVGRMATNTASVFDSYFKGNLLSNSSYVGPIVGAFFAGNVSNVYSAGSFNVNNSNYNGGIIGDAEGHLSDSFSAISVGSGTSNTGGAVGLNDGGSFSNIYYDKYNAGGRNCYGLNDGGNCNAINTDGSDGNYFKNSSTHGPLNIWDFATVWATRPTDFPELRSKAMFNSPDIPNDGDNDANGDEVPDAYQQNVISVLGLDGLYTTIEIPEESLCSIYDGTSINALASKSDTGATHQLPNMTGFSVYCPTPGQTVAVTIIYDKVYDTSKSVLRHFNQTTQSYTTVAGAVFGTRTVNGVERSVATYNLTDGGANDDDGVSNRVMIDPVSIATLVPQVSSTSTLAATGFNNFMYICIFATLSLSGIMLAKFTRKLQ